MTVKIILNVFSACLFSLYIHSANAAIINLDAFIDGAQANVGIGTGSLSTGSAAMTFDTDTLQLRWNITWTPLVSGETAAHFHGPALPNENAGVQVGIGVASNPAIGQAILSAPQQSDLLNGLWYINIHSNDNPGGEIRGQVNVVPVPAAVWLFGSGLFCLFGLARRKQSVYSLFKE